MPSTDADLKRLLRRMVVVTFDDHCSDSKGLVRCWVTGWLVSYTKQKIVVCSWLTTGEAGDRMDHYALIRRAVRSVAELKEV